MSSSQSSGYLEKSSEPRLLLPFSSEVGRRETTKRKERRTKKERVGLDEK